MKRKFLIASHGNLAKGFQSSLDILADKGKELAVINAYVTPEDYTPIIQTFLQSLGAEEQAIILTDLYGGSVNQKIVQEVMTTKPDNVFIISNANLAIALSLIFLKEGAKLTKEDIQAAIAEAQIQFVELNPSTERINSFMPLGTAIFNVICITSFLAASSFATTNKGAFNSLVQTTATWP